MSVAAPARTRPAPRERLPRAAPPAAPRSGRRRRRGRLSATGLAWLTVLGALLGGLVALNVAALRANLDANRVSARALQLEQQNRLLEGRLAYLTAPTRIDRMAERYHMVQATPTRHGYVHVGGRRAGGSVAP